MKFALMADDLTGALDGAVGWCGVGQVKVRLDTRCDIVSDGVVAVDTDTRRQTPAAAMAIVRHWATEAAAREWPFYKKIDSLWRGNTASEIAAVLAAFRELQSGVIGVIAPAFPETGRTVTGGMLYVDARRPGGTSADLVCCLRRVGVEAGHMPQSTVDAGVEAVSSALVAARDAGVAAVLVDSTASRDLDVASEAITRAEARVVPIGSGGLSRALARRAIGAPDTFRGQASGWQPTRRNLIVVGSMSIVARAQVEAARAAGVAVVDLAAPFGRDQYRAAARSIRQVVRRHDVLLRPDPWAAVTASGHDAVAVALGAVVDNVLAFSDDRPDGLILTGGATARAVLDALGVEQLDVWGEIEPGIVYSRLPDRFAMSLVTKAGAFGDAGALERARCAVSNATPSMPDE